MLVSTTDSKSGYKKWSPPRVIFNVTKNGDGDRPLIWPINRLLVDPETGNWLLPSDWGCGGNTGAFNLRSNDNGTSWYADTGIPGIPNQGLCPEAAIAAVNKSTFVAVIRSRGVGFYQSWSHDNGLHWSNATFSSLDGASSKPALISYFPSLNLKHENNILVLAYNVVKRKKMSLSLSIDGGYRWKYFATIDNGTNYTTAYPTAIQRDRQIVTVWSTYGGFSDIKLATTSLPGYL